MTVHSEERSWPSPPDPGDLSRRVARRRAELRLSLSQVAARAGMSPRYLEYLERYPARPGGVGRIAFGTPTGPVVLPVNFTVLASSIVVRTAEGTAIDRHAGEPVALEADHLDQVLRQG